MGIEITEDGPAWLHELVRKIGQQFRPLGFIGQLGFRYLEPDCPGNITRRWLIGVYLIPTELSGGSHDGAAILAGFGLDLLTLISLFSTVTTVEWRVPRSYTDGLSGPEVWLEGMYRDTEAVQLHLYADCPSDEFPSLVLDVATHELRAKSR